MDHLTVEQIAEFEASETLWACREDIRMLICWYARIGLEISTRCPFCNGTGKKLNGIGENCLYCKGDGRNHEESL